MCSNPYPFKMVEYRQKAAIAALAATESAAPVSEATVASGEMPKYMSLAAQYGLEDMDIGASNSPEQTIEQEYQAYITAPLSPKSMDILKFWEVGDSMAIYRCHLLT
jgi:hypothetical protein